LPGSRPTVDYSVLWLPPAKLEYLYVDLGKMSGSFLTTIPALGGGFLTSNYSSRITDNVLRVGVNYKFGGPVVAKY
jgi:outer membrane immunogenic protein